MATALYVLNVQVSQFLRLAAIDISPTGPGVVELTGKNRQGKSSTLEAIWAAIGGEKMTPERPLFEDDAGIMADEGFVSVLVGADAEHPEYRVTRHFKKATKEGEKPYTTRLVVKDKEGLTGGQALLTGWLGSITMDPMAFLTMKPAQQGETLRKMVGLDTTEIDRKRAATFEARRDVNRDLRQLEGELAGLIVPEEIPEAIDVDALLEEQREAEKAQRAEDRRVGNLAYAEKLLEEANSRVETLNAEIEQLKAYLKDAEAEREDAAGHLHGERQKPAVPVPDREAIAARIASAASHNRAHDAGKAAQARHAEVKAKVEAKTTESNALTAGIERLDGQKAKAIAACEMPLKGLAIGDDGSVSYRGKPLSQASSAEAIQVSLAIAMAQQPRLRVIHIRDGSLLDDESKAEVFKFAKKHALQVWMETVRTDNEQAIVIENGRIQGAA